MSREKNETVTKAGWFAIFLLKRRTPPGHRINNGWPLCEIIPSKTCSTLCRTNFVRAWLDQRLRPALTAWDWSSWQGNEAESFLSGNWLRPKINAPTWRAGDQAERNSMPRPLCPRCSSEYVRRVSRVGLGERL